MAESSRVPVYQPKQLRDHMVGQAVVDLCETVRVSPFLGLLAGELQKKTSETVGMNVRRIESFISH